MSFAFSLTFVLGQMGYFFLTIIGVLILIFAITLIKSNWPPSTRTLHRAWILIWLPTFLIVLYLPASFFYSLLEFHPYREAVLRAQAETLHYTKLELQRIKARPDLQNNSGIQACIISAQYDINHNRAAPADFDTDVIDCELSSADYPVAARAASLKQDTWIALLLLLPAPYLLIGAWQWWDSLIEEPDPTEARIDAILRGKSTAQAPKVVRPQGDIPTSKSPLTSSPRGLTVKTKSDGLATVKIKTPDHQVRLWYSLEEEEDDNPYPYLVAVPIDIGPVVHPPDYITSGSVGYTVNLDRSITVHRNLSFADGRSEYSEKTYLPRELRQIENDYKQGLLSAEYRTVLDKQFRNCPPKQFQSRLTCGNQAHDQK